MELGRFEVLKFNIGLMVENFEGGFELNSLALQEREP